jgi:hypothetical protein
MGTQRVQIKAVLPFWFAGRAGTRDFCSALAALVGPVQNIFFLNRHYFNFFIPIAQQVGQATVLGRLSLITVCVSAVTPCTFLHPLNFFVSIIPTVPLSYSEITQFFFFSSTIFTFPVNYIELRHFISAAIFPLICNTVILTFWCVIYPLYCGDRLTGGLEKKRCCETT